MREKLIYFRHYLHLWYPTEYNLINNRLLRTTLKFLSLPFFLLQNAKFLLPNHLAIRYMDLPITTRCSLKCAKCSNLMQYYDNPAHLNTESILKSIETFFHYVDYVVQLNILGGEPFMNTDLVKILKLLISIDKVRRIVILTNGTILPNSPELLRVLANKSVEVRVSDYGRLSAKTNVLRARFSKKGIALEVQKVSNWVDCGDLRKRGRNEIELKKQFASCNTQCRTYYRGQFHVCPRSAHGLDLCFIPVRNSEYIDLKDDGLGKAATQRAIRRLDRHMEYIVACDYCDKGTIMCGVIPPAEQVVSGLSRIARSSQATASTMTDTQKS